MESLVLTDDERFALRMALSELDKAFTQASGYTNPELLGLAELAGLKVIGSGQSRMVVSMGDGRVAKLELSKEGENSREAMIYGAAGPRVRELLCPVLLYEEHELGSWAVMPECEPLGDQEIFEFSEESGEVDLESGPASIGVLVEYVAEDSGLAANLGWWKDNLVVLDYGRGGIHHLAKAEEELERLEVLGAEL